MRLPTIHRSEPGAGVTHGENGKLENSKLGNSKLENSKLGNSEPMKRNGGISAAANGGWRNSKS